MESQQVDRQAVEFRNIGFRSLTICRPSLIGGERNETRRAEGAALTLVRLLAPILPKKFRVKSSEVEIFRRGDEIVLREKAGGMVRVLDLLAELPADMFPKKRKDPYPQRRKGL